MDQTPTTPHSTLDPGTEAKLPNLSEALKAGGVHYGISGGSKGTVFQSMIDALKLPEDVDKAFLLKVLLAREELASTGVATASPSPMCGTRPCSRFPSPWLRFASSSIPLTSPPWTASRSSACSPSSAIPSGLIFTCCPGSPTASGTSSSSRPSSSARRPMSSSARPSGSRRTSSRAQPDPAFRPSPS